MYFLSLFILKINMAQEISASSLVDHGSPSATWGWARDRCIEDNKMLVMPKNELEADAVQELIGSVDISSYLKGYSL